MLLGCGCLLAMLAAFAPRLVLILMWIVGDRISAAFSSWIWPLLGIIFVPYTTIMYVLIWNPVTGISGWDWIWLALGVMMDVMKWGMIANNRKEVPGYPEGAYWDRRTGNKGRSRGTASPRNRACEPPDPGQGVSEMLKLTVFCPADQTDAVVDVLRAEPAVRNVLLLPEAGALEGRDVVMAYLRDGALDAVLAHLRALRTWEAGDLSVINVDLVVRHDVAQMDATGEPGDERGAIGRELMLVQADEEARLSWPYLVFMICAGLIAAIGLVHDLPILIVGAMSLSPDLAPANAIAVTLTMGAFRRMAKALWTLLAGLTLALLVAFVVTATLEAMGAVDSGVAAVDELLTTYVTVLDPFTIIVALAAGVAAMVAFVTEKGLTAVGVAISVTTIPAAAYSGVALASGAFEPALDALGVLVANIVCLVLAQCLTLVLLGAWRRRRDRAAAA